MTEKYSCEELNKLFGPTIQKIEDDLNRWSFGKTIPDHDSRGYSIPTIVSLGNSTIQLKDKDVFNLDPPWAGMIKDLYYKDKSMIGPIIIIRRVYGYTGTKRALELKDPTLILPLIKEMIEALKRDRGFTPDKLNLGTYGTFKRQTGGYFYESKENAGYELRLYSDCTLAEKL